MEMRYIMLRMCFFIAGLRLCLSGFVTTLKVPEGIYSYPKILAKIYTEVSNSCFVDSAYFAPSNGLRTRNQPILFGIQKVQQEITTTVSPQSSSFQTHTVEPTTGSGSSTTQTSVGSTVIGTTATSGNSSTIQPTTNTVTTEQTTGASLTTDSRKEFSTHESVTTNQNTPFTTYNSLTTNQDTKFTARNSLTTYSTNNPATRTSWKINPKIENSELGNSTTISKVESTAEKFTKNSTYETNNISSTNIELVTSVSDVNSTTSYHDMTFNSVKNVLSTETLKNYSKSTTKQSAILNNASNSLNATSPTITTSPTVIASSSSTTFSSWETTNNSTANQSVPLTSTFSPTSSGTPSNATVFELVQLFDLDREKQDKHLLTVQCYDSFANETFFDNLFLVLVEDINDNTPVFKPESLHSYVPASVLVGDAILQLQATDADIGINAELVYGKVPGTERVKYQNGTIVTSNPEMEKAFVLDSGFVVLFHPFDSNVEVSFRVFVKDRGHHADGNRAFATAVVSVYDKNPPFPNPTPKKISSVALPIGLSVAAVVAIALIGFFIYNRRKRKARYQRTLLVIDDDVDNLLDNSEEIVRRDAERNGFESDRRNDDLVFGSLQQLNSSEDRHVIDHINPLS